MRSLHVAVVVVATASTIALAGPRKVLVMPLDGNVDAATRSKLATQITKQTKASADGQVTVAGATYVETATALGCDPQATACTDDVLATMAVDELVWGTATKDGGQIKLVVRRATKGTPAREVSMTLAPQDAADKAETGVVPLFSQTPVEPPVTNPPEGSGSAQGSAAVSDGAGSGSAVAAGSGSAATDAGTQGPSEDNTDRRNAIIFGASGGVALAIGIALWASYSSTQDQIDAHATRTRADFADLTALEDKAQKYAIGGDVMVIVGVGLAAVGGYFFYRDYQGHHVTVAPTATDHSAGVTLSGSW